LLLKCTLVQRSAKNLRLASSICKELEYLALAITQAGSYIAHSCSLGDYLQIYREDRSQLLQAHSVQTTDGYEWTVYTTWEMSLKNLTPTAAMFLRLCSFMHHDGISRAIFQNAAKAHKIKSRSFKDANHYLRNFTSEGRVWSNLKFLGYIKELASYSLINVDPENHFYSIHPLVHAWARERSTAEEHNEAHRCTVQILALAVRYGGTAEDMIFQRNLLPL
jgi:hypothetical protein